MIEQQTNPIQPPPSVDELLRLATDDSRVGQVDFANRLVPDAPPPGADPPERRRPLTVPARVLVLDPEDEADDEPADVRTEPGIASAARLDPFAGPPVPARAAEDLGYLGLSVQEVADAAIERLRDAENATLQHLAALEVEAARRTELLMAQAELDAELIRLTARREAHAIVSAARVQAGRVGQHGRDARQLSEISDAVSRFAESIESGPAPLRPSTHEMDPS